MALSQEELGKLAEHLKIERNKYEGKTKRVIIKVIRSQIEENCDTLESDEEKLGYLTSLSDFIEPSETPSQSQIELRKLQEELSDLEAKQKAIQDKISAAKSSSTSGSEAQVTVEDLSKFVKIPVDGIGQSILRREFRIQGIIGEPNQKDKLGYRALLTQIDAGISKGYLEEEIVSAVTRSVQAGLQLRSYLESLSNLTLDKLRKILRSHFHEKSATELYQVLANMSQGPTEDPQAFLIRALTVRQQILLASEEEAEVGITYDRVSVQKLFLHTLETGLTDEVIRAKIRVLTQNPDVPDEDLIEAVNLAMSAEEERSTKLARSNKSKPSRVNVIEETAVTEGKKESELIATLKAMQAELTSLRSEVNTVRASHTAADGSQARGRPKGCGECVEKGVGDECNHCYVCGGQNHLARHCRLNPKKQGNAGRLPQRDRK